MDIAKGILEGVASAIVVGAWLWLLRQVKRYLDNQKRAERRMDALEAAQTETVETLRARVTDLEVVVGKWPTAGMMWDRSPEAQRIKQVAKEHDKKPTPPPS